MPRRPETRIVLLTRVRDCGLRKHVTLHFTFPGAPKKVRHNVTFVRPEDVPPFDGEQAWFEMERITAKPWSYWRAVRRVEPPPGADGRPRSG